jgi:hypothetical protein
LWTTIMHRFKHCCSGMETLCVNGQGEHDKVQINRSTWNSCRLDADSNSSRGDNSNENAAPS